MRRREFLKMSAAAANAVALDQTLFPAILRSEILATAPAPLRAERNLDRHRFGVNYVPSKNWWFCWNDWDRDSIMRDLDAIAAIGADHLRVQSIWPYFQPNPNWVSPPHLERLDGLLTLMGERNLDALVTVFTGQLSGWFFLPSFNCAGDGFFTDNMVWTAQEVLIRKLAQVSKSHANFIGFDLGNELNTCWSAQPSVGDAWMKKMFSFIDSIMPGYLNINGVDQAPWFETTTFSPQALIADQHIAVMHCYPLWAGSLKYGGAMGPPSVNLLASMAALIRSYAGTQQKPIWAGEFNTCIQSLTDKEQAEWLEKAVLAAMAEGVSWFTYWDSHDLDHKFAFGPEEYSLGLLTNSGAVKPQGRMFKELADAYRGKPVAFPSRSLPPPPPTERNTEASWQWMLDWMGWQPKAAGIKG